MTTYKKKKLKDREGNYIVTPSSADIVYCQDGSTLEQKLNNIENDEFSPTITQVESMAKVGVGTDVDVSANVQDGYVKSAILKGNTKVNLIQEPSSQDVVLPYEFTEGQYVTINDTKETGAVGVELKGQTLVNMIPTINSVNWSCRYNGKIDGNTIIMSKVSGSTNSDIYVKQMNLKLEANKTYLLCYEVVNNVGEVAQIRVNDNSSINTWVLSVDDLTVGKHTVKITTSPNTTVGGFQFFMCNSSNNDASATLKNIALTEYQDGMENWDIPYFEGMQSVQAPSVKTVGKNLFDGELELGSFGENGENVSATSCVRSKNLIRVKPNTLYTFSNDKDYAQYVLQFDENKNKIFAQSYTSFTTLPNTHYIKFRTSQGTNQNDVTVKYQLEESSTPTTYEPYKSTTLTTPEEITLRGIGNVKDTLNTVTGELTQRIGEVVLDGSEEWGVADSSKTNTIAFTCVVENFSKSQPLSNKLPTVSGLGAKDEIGLTYTNDGSGGYRLYIRILKAQLPSNDAVGLKTYLQQNLITVQYELATPITSTVSLTFTDQDHAPTAKLSTYNTTTHINASSQEGSLIPTLSHVNPTYPVILKPSTKYSIVADSYSNDHTNSPINFNLGGATASTTVGNRVTTITTPSTLTSEKLVMSGRGNMLNNVMVIEGDVVGDESYFEGMCDVDMPVVTNVGKNLFDIPLVNGSHDYGTVGKIPEILKYNKRVTNKTGEYIKVKPNTQLTFSINSPYSFAIAEIDSELKSLGDTGWITDTITLTTKPKTQYIGFNFRNGDNVITVEEVLSANPILEESTTPTTYEPYKSNILSCNSEVVLRSLPNGVCDTLDLMTGEYVQRIGEVVLDGSIKSELWAVSSSEHLRLYVPYNGVKRGNCYSDKFINYQAQTGVDSNFESVACVDGGFTFVIAKNKLTTQDENGFNEWLSQNPTTIQYQLQTESIKTVDLEPSGTNPTTKPIVWKDGHIQLLSEQGTLTPSLEYSVITSRGGQILDNTRQIAKQDKRIYDLEMLLISSSIEDAYQRLTLQNSVQMLNYNEELKVNPIRYYMLSRLIEEEMYQESDMLDKLDAFFLYGEITLEQYYELVRLIVGETVATLEEVGCDVSLEYTKEFSQTCMMLMNKLEVSIQRKEDLSHYYELANAYARVNRLTHNEYGAVASRIANAYVSVLPEIVEESDEMLDLDIADEVIESETANEIQTLEE